MLSAKTDSMTHQVHAQVSPEPLAHSLANRDRWRPGSVWNINKILCSYKTWRHYTVSVHAYTQSESCKTLYSRDTFFT